MFIFTIFILYTAAQLQSIIRHLSLLSISCFTGTAQDKTSVSLLTRKFRAFQIFIPLSFGPGSLSGVRRTEPHPRTLHSHGSFTASSPPSSCSLARPGTSLPSPQPPHSQDRLGFLLGKSPPSVTMVKENDVIAIIIILLFIVIAAIAFGIYRLVHTARHQGTLESSGSSESTDGGP